MKLTGIIVVLVLLTASCQKEVITPNTSSNEATTRAKNSTTIDLGDYSNGEVAGTGGGIIDPNSDPGGNGGNKKK